MPVLKHVHMVPYSRYCSCLVHICMTKKAMRSDTPTRPSQQNGQSLASFDIIEDIEDARDHLQRIFGSSNRINMDECVHTVFCENDFGDGGSVLRNGYFPGAHTNFVDELLNATDQEFCLRRGAVDRNSPISRSGNLIGRSEPQNGN